MNAPGFWSQVGIGFALSLIGSALFRLLLPLTGLAVGLRGLSLLLGAAWLLWLAGFGLRHGRILMLGVWTACTLALLLLDPGAIVWLGVPVGLGWLLRLPRYRRLAWGLLDALVSACALLLAIAAGLHSGSAFLALWTFFLLQAWVCFIPTARPTNADADAFTAAERSAEAALHRLSQTTR